MEYKNSAELCQKMAEKTNGVTLLAFSTGKDALSAWVELRKYFHTIYPIYYYMVPGLSFIERSLKYYEDFFETKIIRLPNPNLYRMLDAGTFQTKRSWEIIGKYAFTKMNVKREDLCEWVKEDHGIDKGVYTAIGNRMFDNLQRYRSISKFGAVNHKIKTFFPTYDYKIADVVRGIKGAGVKLPVDYHIWGKTFDGLDYRFIKPVKEHFPDDYEKLKSYFPLIDTEIMRYEQL
ncbi:MAG TPA: hypothetical protein PL085_11630 [Agriterribacter sp.]|uniref:hypothetical protein n=1 Tax=Agriterribacter sp. TaxID=2821509 RepID=UPI002CBB41CC|nr:hypothetical protein [Agriterribacter sp.]HRQ17720.1 hypothetical protein [Agriterribacter sp.]